MQLTPLSSLGTVSKFPPQIPTENRNTLRSSRQEKRSPSYLYLRGSLYYFRYAFSDVVREGVGRSEIRISLRTGYKRDAQPLATALYTEIQYLMRASQLDYMEIRRRMNELLCRLLEQDSRDTSKRKTYDLKEHGLSNFSHADFARGHALILQNMINDPGFREKHGTRMMAELVRSGVFDLEEIAPDDIHLILNEYTKIQQTYHKVVQRRLEGDYSFEAPIFAERAANQQVVTQPATPREEPKNEIPVSEFVSKYIKTKIEDGKWRKDGVTTHKNRLANLIDILGDVDVHSITREDMRGLRETLRQLPPNRQRSQKYKGKSIDEILALKPDKVLSVKTVNITLEAMSSLFEWGIREGLGTPNPAKGLQVPDDRQEIELRDSFTREDLKTIFSAPKYAEDKFIKAAYFWVPLIALYSGMRREEVSQLHLSDVYQHEDGTWVFDVNIKPNRAGIIDKIIKNQKSCIRLVPMHNDLIEIGFLEYCRRIEAEGHERIFPELNKTEKSPKYGKQPGKQFCDLVKSLKLPVAGKKVFHSLRHAFDDAYKLREGYISDVFNQVVAHRMKDLGSKQYGSKFPPKQCYDEVISKIDYGLDLEILKSSRYARGGKNNKA